jgi:hypothetical protein
MKTLAFKVVPAKEDAKAAEVPAEEAPKGRKQKAKNSNRGPTNQ